MIAPCGLLVRMVFTSGASTAAVARRRRHLTQQEWSGGRPHQQPPQVVLEQKVRRATFRFCLARADQTLAEKAQRLRIGFVVDCSGFTRAPVAPTTGQLLVQRFEEPNQKG
jgi:hypothetical protein